MQDTIAWVRDAGVIGLLIIAVIGGFRGWYVFSWYVKELHQRIEKLEKQLERAQSAAEHGIVAADRATRMAERERSDVA